MIRGSRVSSQKQGLEWSFSIRGELGGGASIQSLRLGLGASHLKLGHKDLHWNWGFCM